MKSKLWPIILFAAIWTVEGTSILGQQLVTNGGFETGNFSSWTLSGYTGVQFVLADTNFTHSGTYGAAIGTSGSPASFGYLSQTLPTVPGQLYQISLWLANFSGVTPNEFIVSWNGTTNFDQTNIGGISWTNLLFTNVAMVSNTVLTFGYRQAFYFGLDDVSVQQLGSSVAYTFTTIAGSAGLGSADGVGGDAQFFQPQSVAVDASGNVYVADTQNDTIRLITPAGRVSTIAGFPDVSGSADGLNSAARFSMPTAVAVDRSGNLYVADSENSTLRKITPAGTNWMVSTIAGMAGVSGTNDGTGTNAQFKFPNIFTSIAIDGTTNLYVASQGGNVRKVAPAGTNWIVSTLPAALQGSAIACDAQGNLYLADFDVINRAVPSGSNWNLSLVAGSAANPGYVDATNGAARFYLIGGIGVDAASNIYTTDYQYDTLRKTSPVGTNWVVTTLAGQILGPGLADGTQTNAQFRNPSGVALDQTGNIYVADTDNDAIRRVTSAGVVRTLAGGGGGSAGSADGLGIAARFRRSQGITMDAAGNLYVADTGNDTIREITTAGEVFALAGSPQITGSSNGVGSFARFNSPSGIAVDGSGNVYVSDSGNYTIRELTPAGVVSTIAGAAGIYGNSNGIGTNAQFQAPQGLALDSATNLYIADQGSVRKMTRSGTNWTVNTLASQTDLLYGMAVDGSTNLYVTDFTRGLLLMLTRAGSNWSISTIAGGGSSGTNVGVGSYAGFAEPSGVAVDSATNLYVADTGNDDIRKVSRLGTNWYVAAIGGQAMLEGSADGTGYAALFFSPGGIAVDSEGNLFVADSGNNTIRKGSFTQFGAAEAAPYSQPPTSGQLQVVLTGLPTNLTGQWRFPWDFAWRDSGSIAGNLVPGSYPVEFRSLPGYVPVPPSLDSVAVGGTGVTSITNQYYPTLNVSGTTNTGGLTVNIGPNQVSNPGWRFIGEMAWRAPGSTATNLLPDIYFIEFAPVSGGYSPPVSQAVSVYAGEVSSLLVNYTLAQAVPNSAYLPAPVPNNAVTGAPFEFNGQLQTDVGYGSGVAVEAYVVLTAAHLVFNDFTLAYVNQAYWFFQQEAGEFTSVPQQARGWYILSGYAAQRTNDLQTNNLQNPVYLPDQSSPQSRNFDVAALYFNQPVAGGGYGGYLPSDAVPNPWLTGTANKMLVGYPVDGSLFGAEIINGQMYEIGPQPYPLTEATDVVTNQQEVYTAHWFFSYPGNSGGPLYVELNGNYYPAGVYLGTLFDESQPYLSAVRAIDSNVVNLITLAAAQGTGTNNSGGVILLVPSANISASNPGRIILQLGPPAAVAEGAAWELAGDASYSTATNYVRAVTTTNAISLVFKPIPGWTVPPSQNLSVTPNNTTLATAIYTASSPTMLAVDSSLRLGLTGTIGTTYAIQSRTSLTSGSWVNVSTNTITTSGFNLALPKPNNSQTIFYRAVWLP